MLKTKKPNFINQIKSALKKIPTNRNFQILVYKLLHDVLYVLLFSFTIILIAEGLLPGIITSHIGLLKLVVLLIVTFASILALGKKLGFTYQKTVSFKKSKVLPIAIIFLFLLIGNSLLRFALWENIFITISTLFVFIFFYQLISLEEK
jgi:hypothetical protein